MTITRVQGNAVASSGAVTSQAGTLSTGVAQGNLLVAAVTTGAIGNAVTPPSGWAQAVFNQPSSPANDESGLWYLVVDAGHAGGTSWTFSFGSSHNVYIIIEEWSSSTGWSASPVDQTAVGNTAGTATTSTTPTTGTTSTTTQASELWVATLAYSGGVQTESSITSGWTKDLETHDGSNNHTATMLYQIASSTGTASCSYTVGTPEHWAGAVATFKPGVLVTKDVTFRGVISKTVTKDATFRAPISKTAAKDTTFRGNAGHTTAKNVTFRGVISKAVTKDVTFRAPIGRVTTKDSVFRGNVGHTAAKNTTFRGVLSKVATKDTTFRAPVSIKTAKDVTFRANIITPSISSGGIALYANVPGANTVSYYRFRATQYPDPALSLANVTPRLGNSIVSWDDGVPTNTTLAIKTSLDGVAWTDVTSSNGGSIPGLTGQPDPISDTFNTNTLTNYTNTNKSGGSASTVTYDTANSRISLSGGSGGLYLYTAITDNDVDLQAIMDESDAGGLVWRYVDSSNYYELGCYDDSASGGFTNQLRLYKVVAGTRSLIGSASVVSWPRSTVGMSPYKAVRVTMLGTAITVYFDGIVMQTATDSSFASGQMGLRNDGGTSRYYLLRMQQIGDYVTGTPPGDIVTGDFVYTQVTMSTSDPTVTPSLQDLTTSARSPQIATGALIPQLHDPSKPFAEYFNVELDTIATASGDYWWNVVNGALMFMARQATPAPWCLYSTDLLFAPTVQPTNSADLYRNRQSVTNCIDTITVTNEEKIADGTATSWQMAYPLHSAPTIVVQGVTKTVGIQGIDSGKDFYWQAASNSISQDASATKIPDGYLLQFSYVGQFTRTVTVNNLPEQAARALIEGGTGIVEAWEDGKGMLASNATTYANGLLARFGNNNTVELIAVTQRAGLASGQLLPVFIPEHGILDQYLLIVKLTTTGQQQLDGSVLYEYKIDATNGPNLSNWAKALGL